MFRLMDRVPDGIQPMLEALEEHIVAAGLADMVAAADCITQVCSRWILIKCDILDKFEDFARNHIH